MFSDRPCDVCSPSSDGHDLAVTMSRYVQHELNIGSLWFAMYAFTVLHDAFIFKEKVVEAVWPI